MDEQLIDSLSALGIERETSTLDEHGHPPQNVSPLVALDCAQSSFRLFHILPSLSKDGYLQCHVHAYKLGGEIVFQALSYEWGPALPTMTILLQGQPFQVRRNLYNFLDHARTKSYSQAFWIDALCIDQSNTTERNHQVQLMGQIYSQAEQVIVWLGMVSDAVQDLFRKIKGLDGNTDLDEEWRQMEQFNSSNFWHHFEVLCRHSYWYRAWIIQEIGLARKVVLEHERDSISWSIFIECVQEKIFPILKRLPDLDHNHSARYYKQFISSSRAMNFCYWRMANQRIKETSEMLDLLARFPNAACTDPRDRVFSMVSIATNGKKLMVDYRMNAAQVFLATIMAIQSDEPAKLASKLLAALNLNPQDLLRSDLNDRVVQQTQQTQQGSDLVCPKCLVTLSTAKMQHDSIFVCLASDQGKKRHLQFWYRTGAYGGFRVATISDAQSEVICQRVHKDTHKVVPPRVTTFDLIPGTSF